MAKPNGRNKVTKATGAGVVWSCKACGKGALTANQSKADQAFARHNCTG